ncbi:MAG TPA: EAL domain-containing protein [Lachnospiraceae bacterium]|nr:EAL domain-containing protein [Lachnospiraceae bacterium]
MKKVSLVSSSVIVMTMVLMLVIISSIYHYNKDLDRSLDSFIEITLERNSEAARNNVKINLDSLKERLSGIANTISYSVNLSDNELLDKILYSQSEFYGLGTLTYYNRSNFPTFLASLTSEDNNDYFTDFLAGNSIVLSNTSNPSDQNVYIITPLHDQLTNTMNGALCCTYNTYNFNNYLLKFNTTLDSSSFIINSDGSLLTQSSSFNYESIYALFSYVTFSKGYSSDIVSNAVKNNESGYVHYSLSGSKYFAFYSPLGINNWYIFNIMDSNQLTSNATNITQLASSLNNRFILTIFIFVCLLLILEIFNHINDTRTQKSLLLEKERYDTLIKHSQGVIWEYDILKDCMICETTQKPNVNNSADSYMHIPLDESIIYYKDLNTYKTFCKDLRSGKQEIKSIYRVQCGEGNFLWYESVGITVFKDSMPVSVIGKTSNIDKQQKEYETLKKHAQLDPLTKLYNRTTALSKINTIIEKTQLTTMHAFFMIDIDNFKSINDSLGHIFGDAVLIEFGAKVNKLLDKDSFAFRIGGDEFAIFLCNTPSLEYIETVAMSICNSFKELLVGENNPYEISGSIGISLYPNHGSTFEELFHIADIALYHSKSIGKDCYSIYSKEKMSQIDITPKEHKEASTQDSHALLDNTLLSNVIDVLFDAKDLDFTINFVISLIGNYYNLDRIGVCEYTDDNEYVISTSEWRKHNQSSIYDNALQKIPMNQAESYAYYKNVKSGMFYCRDISTLDLENNLFSEFLHELGVLSFLQCAITDMGTYKGYIFANINKNNQALEKHEIDTIAFLSKIIGGYIRKLRSEEKARLVSKFDLLTESYNLSSFTEEGENILRKENYDHFALLYLDLNKFKQINETYGYTQGDKVLTELTKRVKRILKTNEILGRVIADRFVLLLHYETEAELTSRIEQCLEEFSSIPQTQKDYYNLSLIIGVYYIEENDKMTVAIDRANIARKSIIKRHRNNYAFFDIGMKSHLMKRQEIENIMEKALADEEFTVYYQPKFNLVTGEICGAEALIRWMHTEGIIYPNDFIPTFEENGFIIEIDYYVFEQVCKKLRDLIDNDYKVVPISVNFSRLHFKKNNLVSKLREIITKYDISPDLIEIEITESAIVDQCDYLLSSLDEIQNIGLRLSMDDFGSGMSSLNALRTLPFDILKLDKNFFRTGSTTERERVVISNVVNMARDLKMDIISEGVETQEQAMFLRSIGCEYAQGYLFAKPMPAVEFVNKYLLAAQYS